MTEIRTLRPGLLVSLSTSIKGNVNYVKVFLVNPHMDEDGQERATWETTRVIADPAEHEAAVKVRGQVTYLVRKQCTNSAKWLLCPENKADELYAAIADAHRLTDQFNATAKLTHVDFSVIIGHVAADDAEAVKAVSIELRNLMETMESGVKALDVKTIRDAANKANEIGKMLSDTAKGRLDVAVTAARQAASKIVKAGEYAAVEIDTAILAKIDMARTSFLDMDMDMLDVAEPEMSGVALDLEV